MSEKEVIFAIMDRYCFYRRKYVIMRKDGEKVITLHMDSSYTDKQVWEHLNGIMSLCVFAGPSNTSFLSVDVDERDPEVTQRVVATMVDLGFPEDRIYVSESGGKGYHVDVFFERSIYNWKAKQLYELIIFFGGFNRRKVELRPTSNQAIKLPLGVHQKTGQRCWFVDLRSMNPIEDCEYICRTEKIGAWQIEKILKDGNKRRFNILLEQVNSEAKPKATRTKRRLVDTGEPYRITEPGTRHRVMIAEALRLYRAGGDYGSIHRGLEDWLSQQNPAMYKDPWEECRRDIDNITGWVMQKGRRRELGDDPTHEYHDRTRIYETDARRIITAPTKAARLLAFFITVFCDRYGFCGLSSQKLCEKTGIKSNKTLATASKDLAELGLFHKTNGGYRNIGNALKPVTNKYKFPDGYVRGGEYIEIDGMVTAENVYTLYIHAIAALCAEEENGSLTAPEVADIRRIRNELVGANHADGSDTDARRCS